MTRSVDGARQLLEAAGIAYAIERLSGELPPTLDVVLGWTVREGVTNVVRHSHARHCLLRFTQQQGMIGGEIPNDGVRASEVSEKCASSGTGLTGLWERVSALGGTMEANVLTVSGKPHFRLCVDLPMQVQAGATSRQEK
jgi:two-component system sensor histidine kinase DesK